MERSYEEYRHWLTRNLQANYLQGWDENECLELATLIAQEVQSLNGRGRIADFAQDELTMAVCRIVQLATAIESETGLPSLPPDDYREERNPLE